jgi:hypothetical protein
MTTMTMMMKTTTNKRIARVATLAALAAILVCALSLPAGADDRDKKDKKKKGEESYALIFGTVFGPDLHPVQGVTIKIRRSDQKKPKWELHSDRRGEFAQRVPAGKAEYLVTAEVPKKTGLKPEKPVYTISIENDERQDFVVHLK